MSAKYNNIAIFKYMAKVLKISDKMQIGYSYPLVEPIAKNFDKRFKPELSPEQMLELGVFGGKYLNDCQTEFPAAWFKNAKLSTTYKPELNYFAVAASQPLVVWQKKGWIYFEDPRGWFQWYCRYYMGRRIPDEDQRQINRWLAMKRHISQIKLHCIAGDLSCRKKQRQALLHWAYDSRKY
jgi:hypothetical protein